MKSNFYPHGEYKISIYVSLVLIKYPSAILASGILAQYIVAQKSYYK